MWVEFVVGSLPCSERFFSGYSDFPLSSKTNIYRLYLSGRGQRISVRGCTSERFNLDCGVPQGSCLGPLLFSIYTSSLVCIVQDLLPTVHCYVDDNQLCVSFSPADENGQSEAIAAMESCVMVIRNWMHENRLLMSKETKTEFLLIGMKQQLAKVNVDHVKVGNADIVPHSPVKNLGVWLDLNLSMVEHITKASSLAFFHLYNICRIRKYLPRENMETLIHAFVSSRIDYCMVCLTATYISCSGYKMRPCALYLKKANTAM